MVGHVIRWTLYSLLNSINFQTIFLFQLCMSDAVFSTAQKVFSLVFLNFHVLYANSNFIVRSSQLTHNTTIPTRHESSRWYTLHKQNFPPDFAILRSATGFGSSACQSNDYATKTCLFKSIKCSCSLQYCITKISTCSNVTVEFKLSINVVQTHWLILGSPSPAKWQVRTCFFDLVNFRLWLWKDPSFLKHLTIFL